MVATAVISGLAAVAGIIGQQYANKASREQMEKYRNMLNAEHNKTEEKIQRLENEDALQTKQGSALANEARETLTEQNTAAAGRDAVMGGTGVNAARTKAANTETLRKLYRDIVVNHEATVGARIANLEGIKSNYSNLIAQNTMQQAMANAQAGADAIKGAGQVLQAGAMMYGAQPSKSHNGTGEGVYGGTKEADPNTFKGVETQLSQEELDAIYRRK